MGSILSLLVKQIVSYVESHPQVLENLVLALIQYAEAELKKATAA